MNDNSWVKLYRKLGENPVMGDATALQVFIWLLIRVNKKTGSLIIGRIWASKDLGINQSTFYKALKRLEKKYKIVTCVSNNKYTTVSLLSWAKYQATDNLVTGVGNNKVTTGEQQSNNKVTHNKNIENKRIENKREEASPTYLENLTLEEIENFTSMFNCSKSQVRSTANSIIDYCASKGKVYRDYKATLQQWLRKDYGERKVITGPAASSNVPDEQIAQNFERLANLRNILKEKLSVN